ncbi:hypothetical protein [Sphingobium xenophagum]|uniref:hypothetical protein n=1 Tax=Sphingobium xenophagum TaxID=121428 RepID=UPI0003106DD8|nr:hypothetical protein [Sphingobium xenophagum]
MDDKDLKIATLRREAASYRNQPAIWRIIGHPFAQEDVDRFERAAAAKDAEADRLERQE